MERLRERARRLNKENPQVEKILLFGSIAQRTATPGSDADVCVILKEDHRRFIDRIPDFSEYFSNMGIGVDVFPYTVEEIKKGIPVVRAALKNGIVLQ